MEYLPSAICLFTVLLLLATGIAIKYHKAYWLISGYNTMSEEKKKNVDIKSLGNFIANMIFINSGVILAATVLLFLKLSLAAIIAFLLLLPLAIYTVSKSQSYDGNTKKPDGTTKKETKVFIGVVTGVLVLVMALVVALFYFSSKPAGYSLQNDTLKISGEYGEDIKLSDIAGIKMEEQMPEIQFKSNGSGLGSKMKGYFQLKDVGQAKLFVDTEKPPFIFINVKSGLRIINTDDPAETEKLYDNLLKAWQASNAAK